MFKRIFDIFASLLAILLLSPLFLIIFVSLLFDGRKIIFGHSRVGQYGKKFNCFKFRTMVVNAELVLDEHLKYNLDAKKEWEETFKLKNDPRITKLGHFLRKTSLDELPQFFNVLIGDMSLVGPRPVVQKELDIYYSGSTNEYYKNVKPGITGLWQISGRSDLSYEQRVALDVQYVICNNLYIDLLILLKTPSSLLANKGAY